MNQTIKISVRRLVEFVLRSGDIDNRFVGTDRMLEGSRLHRMIQKQAGSEYTAEVPLSAEFEYRDFAITLEGRADGVIRQEGCVKIDEIKSTTQPVAELTPEQNPLYWAQAKCYGFMIALLEGLQTVEVQLTYIEVESSATRSFTVTCSADELTEFVHGLFDRYIGFAEYESMRLEGRDRSIKALPFPFEHYRAGQRQLAAAAYRSIAAGINLYAQAPTGIGKTISTLFPALKAIGEGQAQKIFYLTAKTITRQVAEEAFKNMAGLGGDFKVITLTAKDKICPHPGTPCNPEHCSYAKGYYDRLNAVLLFILHNESLITRETVTFYAKKYDLCPFELGLDLSEWVDCIICDYNYVFDPIVYLKRYFQTGGGDYVLLVDEAHNLTDRAREMFSATLKKSDFLQAKKLLKGRDKRLAKTANDLNSLFIGLRKACEDDEPLDEESGDTRRIGDGCLVTTEENKELYKLVNGFIRRAEKWLTQNQGVEFYDFMLELYFNCLTFMKIANFYDDCYINFIKTEKGHAGEVTFTLYCIDPSNLLAQTLAHCKSALFFSATLAPLPYFREILGGGENDRTLRLPSPFDSAKLCLLVNNSISTKYKNREASIEAIALQIKAAVGMRRGNYIVYFPSYKYMHDVYDAFLSLCPEVRTTLQQSKMDELSREEFLSQFDASSEQTLVGFCVLGGIFSEGIDLKGERLIGSIIVGVGLPQLSPELDVIADYYRRKNGMGFEYTYMYPGMNKVLQAAGRVIRSEEDRGMVLLIDDRFTRGDYRPLFPPHWGHYIRVKSDEDVRRQLELFWNA